MAFSYRRPLPATRQKSDVEGTRKNKNGTYSPDYLNAIFRGMTKSVKDVAGLPKRIAKRITK